MEEWSVTPRGGFQLVQKAAPAPVIQMTPLSEAQTEALRKQLSGQMQKVGVQVEAAMKKAMADLISATVSKGKLTEADADWLAGLLAELRDRLNALTPNRDDMHQELAAALDIDLARQMLLHGAADLADVRGLIQIVHDRLRKLCAPAQDADVEGSRTAALAEPTPARAVATLLTRANDVLREIEELNIQVRQDLERAQQQQQQQ